jgi:hypothetical protein
MISLFFANLWGWILSHKTIAILTAIGVILLLLLLFQTYCGGKAKPVLDEKLNQEVHEAIETKERKKMEDVFVKVEAKQAEIDANVSNSEAIVVNAQYEAKKKVQAMTDEELRNHLEGLK